ncbi:hypothetical protein SCP_1100710 [Sparassis crispa]|uniref:Uncharacterized protein n=1 Tax=Sparassis crispa TaxID=139825 RepID=A0A401GZ04_9APHY|nr:hypothetical protein SCP_1100710 [Sparassis crispa]GBE87395.1 hypothetical protein SCP_1100710 [Sparassis crispa]
MSSNIPTRRVTRATRAVAVLKDKENATARNLRATTARTKPSSSAAAGASADVKPTGIARATASTAATRAKAVTAVKADPAVQAKRKREALGEVAKPSENKVKPVNAGPGPAGVKGKERVKELKEKFEGVVLKKTTTTATVRQPLRTVVGKTTTTTTTNTTRRTRSATTAEQQQQHEQEQEHQLQLHREKLQRERQHRAQALREREQREQELREQEQREQEELERLRRERLRLQRENEELQRQHELMQRQQQRRSQLPPPPHRRYRQLERVQENVEPMPEQENEAMAVDPVMPVPSPRRFVAARASAAARPPPPSARAQQRRPLWRRQAEEDEDEEAGRVFKKRRTSSDAPEEAALHALEVEEAVRFVSEPEADPNGKEWKDLDAEDEDDPLMVSEYVAEIFEYLKQVEQTTMPNPNYMENQKDLAWKMRGILTDWLIQVHARFKLLPETLFLCVNIIDRFLSARVVSLAKLQLVGITCMFVAAKVEEIVAPSATNFLYCADSSYSEHEILQAERYVLKTIEWNLSYPNPIHFLRRISKADDYNVQVRTIAKYFLEIQCLEWRLIAAPPSLLAAAAIWLARIVLNYVDWTPNLAHYSTYPESALVPTANLMLNYVLKPVRHQSFYKKYAAKKFFKASVFVRDWALARWREGTTVSLPDVLHEVKALAREIREREEEAAAQAAAADAVAVKY